MIRRLLILLCLIAARWPVPALAQSDSGLGASAIGIGASGGAGVDRAVEPVMPRGVTVSVDLGYGFMEAIGDVDAIQHRATGRVAAAVAPLPFLTAGLLLDGRLDLHPDDGMGSHTTGVGDPRLFARLGHPLSSSLAIGFEAGLWLPGNDAPSFELAATTIDARALARYRAGDWYLLSAAGFRFDQSQKAAPDLIRLRPGDRQVLGLSDAHAVLLALSVCRAVGARTLLFGELSGDLLVGSDAPGLSSSPLRVKLGVRRGLSDQLAAEAALTIGLSARPAITPDDPLVPIEPRLGFTVGLRFGHRFDRPKPPELEVEPAPGPATTPEVPQTTTVAGQLLDDEGAPLSEALVQMRAGEAAPREVISDAEGRFRFEDVPVGPVEIVVATDGFEPITIQVDAQVGMTTIPTQTLVAKPPGGLLRGLTRSFDSEGLPARVRVLDARSRRVAEVKADAAGQFELSLPPGRYTVMIDMPGYGGQRHQVTIEDRGVTVLNADLRK